ncbi:hypothetical protein [Capnocytophaga canimorsus]
MFLTSPLCGRPKNKALWDNNPKSGVIRFLTAHSEERLYIP